MEPGSTVLISNIDATHLVQTVNTTIAGASLHGTIFGSDNVTPVAQADVLVLKAGKVIAAVPPSTMVLTASSP